MRIITKWITIMKRDLPKMPKTGKLDFVREHFEKEGYTLLSTEYTNSNSKLNYRCPQGHIHAISWDKYRDGRRCLQCKQLALRVPLEIVQSALDEEEYILLSTEYVNYKLRIDYSCPQGHYRKTAWTSFKEGKRCKTCALAGGYTEKYFTKYPDKKDEPAFLYYFEFEDGRQTFRKIGITINWDSRKHKFPFPIKPLRVKSMTLYRAFLIEQRFKRYYNKSNIKPPTKFGGWTECFLVQ